MSKESYDKSFRFLEQDWENIYDRPKSSIAEYLRGMCEFAFSGIVPPKSERARFAGYNAIRARVMKGRRDTTPDTNADTPQDTATDTNTDTREVPCQEYKNNTSSLKSKTASGTREDVLTYDEVLAHITGPHVSTNLRPSDPAAFAEWFMGEMRKTSWINSQGVRLNHGQTIRLIGFKLEDWKKNTARAAVESSGRVERDPATVIDLEG